MLVHLREMKEFALNNDLYEYTILRINPDSSSRFFLAKRSGKNLSLSLSVWTNEKTRFPRMHQSEERGKKRKAVTVLTPGWTQPPKSHGKLMVQPIWMQNFIFLITLAVSTWTHEFWNHSVYKVNHFPNMAHLGSFNHNFLRIFEGNFGSILIFDLLCWSPTWKSEIW